MIIVDASVVIEIVLATPEGHAIQQRLRATERPLGAPHLIDLEVLQVLRRLSRHHEIDAAQAQDALRLLNALPVNRFEHQIVNDRIWPLRNTLTAYDASYFALAELLDAPLWTRDRKFASIPGHKAQIVLC